MGLGSVGSGLSQAGSAIGQGAGAVWNFISQKGATNAAKNAANNAINQQQQFEQNLLKQQQLQPTPTPPDNFLAQKAAQLSSLRMGIVANMTAGKKRNVANAALNTPTLTAPPLKTKSGQ